MGKGHIVMARQLPVPFRSEQAAMAQRPEVIVIEPQGRGRPELVNPVARLAVSVTPDIIRGIHRLRSRRENALPAAPVAQPVTRVFNSGLQLSEVEYDLRVPFVRKVTIRKATAWASEMPAATGGSSKRSGRARLAGVLSAGAFVAIAGLLVNRASNISTVMLRRD